MTDSNYIKIYTGNFAVVKRITIELNDMDINPVVKDQAESAILGGFGGTLAPDFQEVYVHKDELEKATKVVNDITSELEA
ncbi:putative signal transducing protein [Mariniflexile sp. HNIBRBA6329]|uniref:putative signal transducing protein n=1 Tax=Mariniflexile sp. HNIBRBA6329 TaxID=3373088 RepID=UPI0037463815